MTKQLPILRTNMRIQHQLDAIWTDGQTTIAVGIDGCVVRYHDGNFELMQSNTERNLHAVWGTNSANVFAVGQHGTIIHYNGIAWRQLESNTPERLNGIWGFGPDCVFAVGNKGVILKYNGIDWKPTVTTPNELNAVWGTSDSNVFAVGGAGTVLHYDGQRWNKSVVGRLNLQSVWGIDDAVFAVGSNNTVLHRGQFGWTTVELHTVSNNIYSVHGTATNDIFIVGDKGLMMHYDGVRWRTAETECSRQLNGVCMLDHNNIMVVGGGAVLKFDRAAMNFLFRSK